MHERCSYIYIVDQILTFLLISLKGWI